MHGNEVRKVVKEVLAKYGKENRFSVRRVSFSDLARKDVWVATIKNWEPDPVANDIQRELKRHQIIVEFE